MPSGLSNLKSKVDKWDVHMLTNAPNDLSKLSNAAKNDAVRKMYMMLRSKVVKVIYPVLLT